MWPDRVSNPRPLTIQVPYPLRYAARPVLGKPQAFETISACTHSLKVIYYKTPITVTYFRKIAHMTEEPEVSGSIPGLAFTFVETDHEIFFYSHFPILLIEEGQLSVCHLVLVNRLGGLSLSRNSVVRLTDRPDMTHSCLPRT